MDNTQTQILNNFRELFGKYKPTIINNGKQVSITVDGDTTVVNQAQRSVSNKTIRLS